MFTKKNIRENYLNFDKEPQSATLSQNLPTARINKSDLSEIPLY